MMDTPIDTMTVSQLAPSGIYLGPAIADPSPLEPDVWLLPGGCVDALPPHIPAGKRARWTGTEFTIEDCPPPVVVPDAPEPPPLPPSVQRAAAYRDEADPLYFRAMRGEASLDDWRAKISEIRARYPDPETIKT